MIDEQIEKYVALMAYRLPINRLDWEDELAAIVRVIATAAESAAIERCAKVAEIGACKLFSERNRQICEDIAAAIRQLKGDK